MLLQGHHQEAGGSPARLWFGLWWNAFQWREQMLWLHRLWGEPAAFGHHHVFNHHGNFYFTDHHIRNDHFGHFHFNRHHHDSDSLPISCLQRTGWQHLWWYQNFLRTYISHRWWMQTPMLHWFHVPPCQARRNCEPQRLPRTSLDLENIWSCWISLSWIERTTQPSRPLKKSCSDTRPLLEFQVRWLRVHIGHWQLPLADHSLHSGCLVWRDLLSTSCFWHVPISAPCPVGEFRFFAFLF